MPATAQYHVVVDGQGYLVDPATYRHRPASKFAAKTRVGDAGFGDLVNGSAWQQQSWQEGFGFLEWDPQHPTRVADANSVDFSFGDVRMGRAISSVSAVGMRDFTIFQGTLYAITRSDDKIYSSADGQVWAVAADLSAAGIGSTATSLRCMWIHDNLLMVGSGSNGQIFSSVDGATWTLYATITNATAITAAVIYRYADSGSPTLSYVAAAGVTPAPAAAVGQSSIFSISSGGPPLGVGSLPWPRIDAMTLYGNEFYLAGVDDTVALSIVGALFLATGSPGSLLTTRLVQEIPDNAIESFLAYDGDLLAGSRTRGKVWKVSQQGLKEFISVPEIAMSGTPPAYTKAIRALVADNSRLYFPAIDVTGLGIYQWDGVGLTRLANTGTTPSEAYALTAFNDALLVAVDSNIYRTPRDTYAASGIVYTPWFDAELASIDKTLTRLSIAHAPLTTGQSIAVDYALDDAAGWTALGTSNTVGASTATFAFATNIRGRRIRLRFTLALTTTTATPKLRAVVLEYQLEPDLKHEFVFDPMLEGTAQNPLKRLDTSEEPLTGAQLRAAIWASKAKKQTVAYTDTDGTAYTVWFAELEDRLLREHDASRQGWRGTARLVEA